MKEQEHGKQWLVNNIVGAISGTAVMTILSIFIPGWWWYMIIGFIWVGTITTLIRYYAIDRIHCPKCNQPATKFDKFCKFCGHLFLTTCPQCQKPVDVGARFCDSCGAQLEELKQPQEVELAKPKTPAQVVQFCPGCGEKIENTNAKHCSFCGTGIK